MTASEPTPYTLTDDEVCGAPVDGGACALRPEHGGLHKPAETPDGGA